MTDVLEPRQGEGAADDGSREERTRVNRLLGRLAWDVVWLAIAALYTWKAFEYTGSTGSFPRLVGVALVALALGDTLATGAKAWRHGLRRDTASVLRRGKASGAIVRVAGALGLCAVFVAVWGRLGAALDVIMFVLGGALLMGARRPRHLGAAVLVGVGCVALFEALAHFSNGVTLPRGVLPKLGGL